MGLRKRQAAGGHTLKHIMWSKDRLVGLYFLNNRRLASVFKAENSMHIIYFKEDRKTVEDRQGRKLLRKVI